MERFGCCVTGECRGRMAGKGGEVARALRWLDDYGKVSKWMRQFGNLEERIEQEGRSPFISSIHILTQ